MGRPLRCVTPVQRPSLLTRMTPVFVETRHRKRPVLALVWRTLRSRFVSLNAMWGNSIVTPTGTRASVASVALHLQRRSFSTSCSAPQFDNTEHGLSSDHLSDCKRYEVCVGIRSLHGIAILGRIAGLEACQEILDRAFEDQGRGRNVTFKRTPAGETLANGIRDPIATAIMSKSRHRRVNVLHFEKLALSGIFIHTVYSAAVGSQHNSIAASQDDAGGRHGSHGGGSADQHSDEHSSCEQNCSRQAHWFALV